MSSEKDIPEFYTDHGPLGNSIKVSLSEIGSGLKPSNRQQKKSLTQDNFFFLVWKGHISKSFHHREILTYRLLVKYWQNSQL